MALDTNAEMTPKYETGAPLLKMTFKQSNNPWSQPAPKEFIVPVGSNCNIWYADHICFRDPIIEHSDGTT